MRRTSPMGFALRELCDEDSRGGDGPIEVMTRLSDFNVVSVKGPNDLPMSAPANSLVAFTAMSFRELMRGQEIPTDVWAFRVKTPEGTWATMYLAGADVFLVRAPSKVAI